MTRDIEYPPRGYTTQDLRAVIAAEGGRGRRPSGAISLALTLGATALATVWAAASLWLVTGVGQRTGIVERFGRVGRVCPVWEGEVTTATTFGADPERWTFTVRDSLVAERIDSLFQAGVPTLLAYESHLPGYSTCVGERGDLVTAARPGRMRGGLTARAAGRPE